MLLDMRTLWVVIVITYVLMGSLQLTLWRLQPRERAMLLWGLSHFSLALGGVLFIQRGAVPDWLSIGIGNWLTMSGYLLMTAGLRYFAHQPVRWAWILVPPALTMLLFTLVPLFATQAWPRIVLLSLVLAACSIINLRDGWQAQKQEPLTLRWIAMASFAAALVYALVRAVLNLTVAMPANFMAPDALQPLLMAVGLGLLMFWNFTVMLIPTERQRNQLRRAAQDDALTNLLNRGGFTALASRQIERCRYARQPASVLLMDLDHFKRVNDSHGHEAGDRLLCAFAETVRSQSRPSDLVARYGGEEFCALLPNASQDMALAIAERIRQQFSELTLDVGGTALGTTVSIGVAEIGATETTEAALQRADQALYAAKREGRNRVTSAAPSSA